MLKQAPFCYYLIFTLFGGLRNCRCAFTTCRRADSVAGTFLCPILTFLESFLLFSPNSGCMGSKQASVSFIAAGRIINALLCRGWSAPCRPRAAHAAFGQRRTASFTHQTGKLHGIKTEFGKQNLLINHERNWKNKRKNVSFFSYQTNYTKML